MKETEVKFLEINKKEIIRKLARLGAKKVFEGDIEAYFFDYPDKRLNKRGKILRLRKKSKEIEFNLKQNMIVTAAKNVDETEVNISDFELMKKILESIGLEISHTLPKKHRTSYSLNDLHFEIEKYKGIPAFLEIESDSEEKLKKAARLLGLDMKDAKSWTQKEVLEYYK